MSQAQDVWNEQHWRTWTWRRRKESLDGDREVKRQPRSRSSKGLLFWVAEGVECLALKPRDQPEKGMRTGTVQSLDHTTNFSG
ncbi:hypothetical protein POX_e07205 [Penicillium oxalicum]|uniref:Uncharacterized protein n=1 Tax=Penicillium oxalicum (strain 114-2 / CGMCC 5302) TaxID=933388 RepID=S7ZD96_PENO1|nr:hypothetical protein POX_e07205 [Penicillium oxalicum]EPS28234.1 hypothetical protein PDE_03180 [Penicillium oxalicum 114-2]KAI2789177.1 hypothetical protein POX_e07205 [Penicillium oxalicum]